MGPDAFTEAALRLNRDRAQVLLVVEPVDGSATEWRYGLLEGTAVTSWRRLRVEGKRYTFLDVVEWTWSSLAGRTGSP